MAIGVTPDPFSPPKTQEKSGLGTRLETNRYKAVTVPEYKLRNQRCFLLWVFGKLFQQSVSLVSLGIAHCTRRLLAISTTHTGGVCIVMLK